MIDPTVTSQKLRAAGMVLAVFLSWATSPGCADGGQAAQDPLADKGQSAAQTKPTDWKSTLVGIVSKVTLATEHGTLLYAFDSLAYPGKSVDLIARVLAVRKMDHPKDVTIEFLHAGRSLGKVKTDEEGYAKLVWTPPKAGDYQMTARITAVPDSDYNDMLKVTPTPLLVAARARKSRMIVIDLDHTVVASSFFRVIVGGAKPMPKAAEVIGQLSKKYGIVYLTHRPDLLTVKSKTWLSKNGFPRAPLLVSKLSQAIGDSGKFKTGRLRELRKQYPNVAIGIGDRVTDVKAYVDNGLKAYLIPHYDRNDDDDVDDMAEDIGKIRTDIQVVDGWEQIGASILRGQKFPAAPFARKLRARAEWLRKEKQRKKREKQRREREEEEEDDD
ncbi:hypothetical protein LCGC14_2141170 [marine sediment metagenome]|uniref:LNS2/PITP domain-containing protein n=1 Tax=marine sediment metagenome TaxID=412755 RepID=A0A0F9GBJ3_9ZZZZ